MLVPAATILINTVMPVLFWLAALDAGKRTGFWGTLFGGLSQLVMGNAVPGVVLGILIGKGVDDLGWTRMTRGMLGAIIIYFKWLLPRVRLRNDRKFPLVYSSMVK